MNTLLNILLLSFGISTIVVLLLFSYQLEENLYKNAEGIDAVVGAKGSPIQLILSGIFHIDSPTGNIDLKEAKELINNPMVASVIPQAMGDNYRGYRIVGTTSDYPARYQATLARGSLWEHEFEVVLGADVAANERLNVGDTIVSSHGFSAAGHTHDDHDLTIVGIFQSTGTVIDRLILTGVETMWGIHQPHEEHDHHSDHEHHNEHDHNQKNDHGHHNGHHNHHDKTEHHHHDGPHNHEENHGHDHDHNHSGREYQDSAELIAAHQSDEHHQHDHSRGRSINDQSYLSDDYVNEQLTTLLIQYRNPLAAAQFPRFVNENTSMQAAAPAIEITRLLNLLGVGLDAIRIFAYILILASVLGIFIALLNSLKERKYDLAIMRSLGGSRVKLFLHIILEGMIIALAGGLLGILLGHMAIESAALFLEEVQQFAVSGRVFIPGEGRVLLLAVIIGLIASIIPAIQAYKTDIAITLSKS